MPRGVITNFQVWFTLVLVSLLASQRAGAQPGVSSDTAVSQGTVARDSITAADVMPSAEQAAAAAAVVNGEPVAVGEVARLLASALGNRKVAPRAMPRVQAEALEQAIDRRLVAQYLRQHDQGISADELDVVFKQFRQSLELQKLPYEEYLKKQHMTEEQLRQQLYWALSWRRYTARHITDEILERRFERDRKRYDGSEVRVAHLLLKPPSGHDLAGALPGLLADAQAIKARIEGGELTFEQAVAQHSQGTRENGGDLGFITWPGSMPQPFSEAAFALEVGQVSAPVATPFGVHLIRCTEIKPGSRTLDDVRRQVQQDVIQEGFARLAEQARQSAKVEYTTAWPHFKPGTEELAGAAP